MIVLSQTKQEEVIREAKSHTGTPYSRRSFNCEHFVRLVYKKVLGSSKLPCLSKNLREGDLKYHQDHDYCFRGYVLYLVKKDRVEMKRCSHLAILNQETVIHCSYYFGSCVVETDLYEILSKYRLSTLINKSKTT